jgi:hypothetical protein
VCVYQKVRDISGVEIEELRKKKGRRMIKINNKY